MRPCSGSVAIILAGVATVCLMGMGLSLSFVAQSKSKRIAELYNAQDGFYAGELAVWNSYYRSINPLLPPPDPSANPIQLDVNYLKKAAIQALPDSKYNNKTYAKGTPINVRKTKDFDPGPTFFKRYSEGSVGFSPRIHGLTEPQSFCGTTNFMGEEKAMYRTCLSDVTTLAPPPPGPPPPPPPPAPPPGNWYQANKKECGAFCTSLGLVNDFSPDINLGEYPYANLNQAVGSKCSSGEVSPISARGKITYTYGTWGCCYQGTRPKLTSFHARSFGNRCYGKDNDSTGKHDGDDTDYTVGCYCRN